MDGREASLTRHKLIVLLGLSGTGKTNFVKQLRGVSHSSTWPTMGINVENISYKHTNLLFFDLGGVKTIRTLLWDHYLPLADAVIFMADGTCPQAFSQVSQCLLRVLQQVTPGLPVLLLWNKRDLPDFIPFAQSKVGVGLPVVIEGFKPCLTVFETSILENQNVTSALDWLVESLSRPRMKKPIRLQALRIFNRITKTLLFDGGYTTVFEIPLERFTEALVHSDTWIRHRPLLGGNYAISYPFEDNYCIAIFANDTPVDSANSFAPLAVQFIKAKTQQLRQAFSITSLDTDSIIANLQSDLLLEEINLQ